MNYSKINSIIKHTSKSKDNTILTCMSFIDPLSNNTNPGSQELDNYTSKLSELLKDISPNSPNSVSLYCPNKECALSSIIMQSYIFFNS